MFVSRSAEALNCCAKLPDGPGTKPNDDIILLALTLAMMTDKTSAQQLTIHDPGGNVVGRSSTDSSGAVTN